MSGNRIVFDGLDELRAALRQLPDELTAEGGHIVQGWTNYAEAQIKGKYPRRTGDLDDHASASIQTDRFSVIGTVVNTSKLAYIFENGTQARHNALGANRGAMPAGHVFIPAVISARRNMYQDLKDLLVRNGLLVSGDA